MIKVLLYTLIFCLLGSYNSLAQSREAFTTLNEYVQFMNESVHGLTVAHILFVNYNKDLNKYVDLESHKINTHITNDELGDNIFDNPDINTSDDNNSAVSLSRSIAQSNTSAPASAKSLVKQMTAILSNINSLRFDIGNFISTSDLNQRENIYRSYELLEKAVSYFTEYDVLHDKLARVLRSEIRLKDDSVQYLLNEIHGATVEMIRVLRQDRTDNLDSYITRIKGAMDNLDGATGHYTGDNKNLISEIGRQVREMCSFVANNKSGALPDVHKLYGRSYYIHNRILLTNINSISPGFASKLNYLNENLGNAVLNYDDRPILYKVVYPEKIEELEEIVAKKILKPKTRSVDVTSPAEINLPPPAPENDFVDLEFYDPDLIDRDSISVSFNDEWILTDYKLTEEPYKVRLEIDPQKGNSVFILAKNEGIVAPNTVGFKYRYNAKGKKKTFYKRLHSGHGYELILTIEGLGGFSDDPVRN